MHLKGIQGGPNEAAVAAKAVCFDEAAMTTRGLSAEEFRTIGNIIGRRLSGSDMELKTEVMEILKQHPIY